MKQILTALVIAIGLSGCGTDPDERDLLAPQRDALQRAEDVEPFLQNAAARQRRLIDESEG